MAAPDPELAELLRRMVALAPLSIDARRTAGAIDQPLETQWRYLMRSNRNISSEDLDDTGRQELADIMLAAAEFQRAHPHLSRNPNVVQRPGPDRATPDDIRRLHEIREELESMDARRPRLVAERDALIRRFVESEGYEQARVAFAAGVSRQRLSQIVRASRSPGS